MSTDVLDAEVVEDAEADSTTRSGSTTGKKPKTPKKSATVHGARRDRDNHDDAFERRLAQFEVSATEYMRDMHHRAKQARRTVTKKSNQFKRKKVRTTVGMATRVAGVTAAGGYLATRSTIKTTRRAYKRASPHVRRAAGHTARTVHSYATVYGEHYATRAQRRAMRMRAHARVAGRRREQYRKDPLYHASMVAGGYTTTRNYRVARRAAGLLDPRSKRTAGRRPRQHRVPAAGHRRPTTSTRQQDAATRERARAVRRDPYSRIPVPEPERWDGVIDAGREYVPRHLRERARTNPIPTQRSTRSRSSSTTTPRGGAMATTTAGSTTNPASVLDHGFKLTGEFEPLNWTAWMQQLRDQAAAFRQGSESYLQLAVYMDLKRRMDPRALMPFYILAAACGQMADLFLAAANQFWALYSDRVEKNGRGRTMDDENRFFGQ